MNKINEIKIKKNKTESVSLRKCPCDHSDLPIKQRVFKRYHSDKYF